MTEVPAAVPDPGVPRDERRRDRSEDGRKERSGEDRRRDRDSRERRDDKAGPRDGRGDERGPRRSGEHHEKRGNHDGSGSGSERRDRDREHKRRKTPSPPAHRDRRHSPVRRTPPYKRTRRDDDILAGDTAFPADRRHGYDGMGQYDRAGTLGGRGGFGDDRVRHPGSRGWQGPGRSGFSDGPHHSSGMYAGLPNRREGLMTYKLFIAELEDDILPAEAERRYEEYKAEYITTQKRAYFAQHKDDEWLREKYDPSKLESVLLRRNENAKALAKDFQAELEAGTLDVGPIGTGSRAAEGASEEDTEMGGKRRRPARAQSKDKELDAAPKVSSISGDPKRFPKDIDQARALIKKLDSEKGIEGNILTQDNQNVEGDRSLSGSSAGHIVIVRGANQVKGYEGLELLDVMLTYLWRVHSLDYYGGIELRESARGYRHVRKDTKVADEPGSVTAADWEKKIDGTWQARLQGRDLIESMLGREKLETAANDALDPFVRKIKDDKYGWKYGCGAKGCTKLFHGPEYVHKHLKLKHPELVSDVIAKSRHDLFFQNYMSDPGAPGVSANVAFQPSQRDKGGRRRRHGGGNGGIGGPAERMAGDRMQILAQGPHAAGRDLRDSERFERRENDRFDRPGVEDERFDRGGEQSPSNREFTPSGMVAPSHDAMGGPQGSFDTSGDPPMFDPFSGPPMRGPPAYGSDMPPPPPVLMPVPGAGPLGPFVPAPPEVAMRMLREQGGPPAFHPAAFEPAFDGEANGGGHGRRGRSHHGGHMVGGLMDNPPLMVPMGQALRPDPRHVRSYHDLDAPEDEVTVIDYRSL